MILTHFFILQFRAPKKKSVCLKTEPVVKKEVVKNEPVVKKEVKKAVSVETVKQTVKRKRMKQPGKLSAPVDAVCQTDRSWMTEKPEKLRRLRQALRT